MSLMFVWTCSNSLVEATEQLESAAAAILDPSAAVAAATAGAAAADPAGGRSGWLDRWLDSRAVGFMRPLLSLLLMQPTWRHLDTVLGGDSLPQALGSKKGERSGRLPTEVAVSLPSPVFIFVQQHKPSNSPSHPSPYQTQSHPAAFLAALQDRNFQATFKFVLATGTVLLLLLGLSATNPVVRAAQPIFGYVATCVAVQERVEATADKVGFFGGGRGDESRGTGRVL
jgi:hypothetical protein